MRKKILTIAAIAVVLLASCAKPGKQPNKPKTTPTTKPTPTVEATETDTPMPEGLASVDAIKKASIGDIVKFGSYEQDNDLSNGAEEIEWIVLDQKDGKYLLLSKYGLDAQPYNTVREDVTWETCTLRSWLNNDFYTMAFSQKECDYIATTTVKNADHPRYGTEGGNDTKDKVFLLSVEETLTYFSSDPGESDPARRAKVTEYAKEQGAYGYEFDDEYYGNTHWWLRSPGDSRDEAAHVFDGGAVYGLSDSFAVVLDSVSVRPALWIEP